MARTKPSSKPRRRANIASRADFQYVAAFLAGTLMPCVGSALSAAASSALWASLAHGYTRVNITTNTIVQALMLAIMGVVYLAGLAGFIAIMRRFGVRSNGQGTLRAIIASGFVLLVAITISLQAFTLAGSPDAYMCYDAVIVVLFGLGYALGWWVLRRYAKLTK